MAILVNGERVEDDLIRQEAQLVKARLVEAAVDDDPLTIDMRAWEWAKENLIERVLFRQAAMNEPDTAAKQDSDVSQNDVSPNQDRNAAPEIELRIARLSARVTANVGRPRKKDVTEFYRRHRDSFYAPETIRAAHIVKNVDEGTDEASASDAIRAIQKELEEGKPFEEVADLRSDCPGRGGDLGFFGRGQMVQEFEDVVFPMKPGEVSRIFRSPFGFHIAKLYERRPEGVRELSEVYDEIEQHLIRGSQQTCLEQFVDELRAKADIRKA